MAAQILCDVCMTSGGSNIVILVSYGRNKTYLYMPNMLLQGGGQAAIYEPHATFWSLNAGLMTHVVFVCSDVM